MVSPLRCRPMRKGGGGLRVRQPLIVHTATVAAIVHTDAQNERIQLEMQQETHHAAEDLHVIHAGAAESSIDQMSAVFNKNEAAERMPNLQFN